MSKRSGKKANWLKPGEHLKINKKFLIEGLII